MLSLQRFSSWTKLIIVRIGKRSALLVFLTMIITQDVVASSMVYLRIPWIEIMQTQIMMKRMIPI